MNNCEYKYDDNNTPEWIKKAHESKDETVFVLKCKSPSGKCKDINLDILSSSQLCLSLEPQDCLCCEYLKIIKL